MNPTGAGTDWTAVVLRRLAAAARSPLTRTMSSDTADPAVSTTPGNPILGRSLLIAAAWNIIPCVDLVLTAATYVKDRPGCVDACAFDGLAVAAELMLLLMSLGLSLVLLAVLIVLSRRWPRLRRAAVLGNAAAAPGIVLTAVGVFQLASWLLS